MTITVMSSSTSSKRETAVMFSLPGLFATRIFGRVKMLTKQNLRDVVAYRRAGALEDELASEFSRAAVEFACPNCPSLPRSEKFVTRRPTLRRRARTARRSKPGAHPRRPSRAQSRANLPLATGGVRQ